jgi:Holliday junction resolvase
MENKVFIYIEKYDVYEVLCFYNNEKAATLAYIYYKPDNSQQWRVLSKVLKKAPYNSNCNLDKCETIYEEVYDVSNEASTYPAD